MPGTFGPQQQNRIVRSYVADVALAAGVAVIAGAAVNSVKLPTAANLQSLGITLQACAAGDTVAVLEFGETKVVADAAFARGALLMINAVTGKLAAIGAVAGTNYFVLALALELAAAQNDEVTVLVNMSRAQG
jgi:hypothetical protein